MLGVRSGTSVWPPGHGPLPPPSWPAPGRTAPRLRRDAEHRPVTLKTLACSLPARAWRSLTWRAGPQGELASRFAAVRVRPAHRDTQRSEPWPQEWLLIEWPNGEAEPTKSWFSNLPRRTPRPRLARVSSSWKPVHRSLRLSDRRALPFSPSTAFHPQADQNTCTTREISAAG